MSLARNRQLQLCELIKRPNESISSLLLLSPHLESSIAVVLEQPNYAGITVSTVCEPNPISTLSSIAFLSQNRRKSSLLLSRPIAYPNEPNHSQCVSPIASIFGGPVFEWPHNLPPASAFYWLVILPAFLLTMLI